MDAEETHAFRSKLAEAGIDAELGDGEPTFVWVNKWQDSKCVDARCYQNGTEVDIVDRLADQADAAVKLGLIEEKDIPTEIKEAIDAKG